MPRRDHNNDDHDDVRVEDVRPRLAELADDALDEIDLDATRGSRYANNLRVPRPPQADLDRAEGLEVAPAGRPPFRLTDRERGQIVAMAAIGCTYREIASVMGISRDSIIRHCQELIHQGKSQGRMSLRRAQWRKAVVDGHPGMLIWLGKQMLAQRDRTDTQVTGQGGGPVEAEVTIGSAVDTVLNRLGAIAQRRRLGANTAEAIQERRELVRAAQPNPEN